MPKPTFIKVQDLLNQSGSEDVREVKNTGKDSIKKLLTVAINEFRIKDKEKSGLISKMTYEHFTIIKSLAKKAGEERWIQKQL